MYSCKLVVLGQNFLYLGKLVVFKQNWFYLEIYLADGQN